MSTVEVPISKALFLIPFAYTSDGELLEHPDFALHLGVLEARLIQDGIFVCKDLPKAYKFAEQASEEKMHYRVILSADRKNTYIPLFTSYRDMIHIFGIRIRVALICYETACEMCNLENLDGIVLGPGSLNEIITKENLHAGTGNIN